ncbi:AAA family ATPase [Actinocrinis puniceicyclus]|uniref:AAA family ATPase n=1 Tax=Actinocrinis puniceicyclus TaxID=977794 RepID=A0A8J8BBS0_9ACTN|nr:ArsA-related P-loop ATPase [Actinocrinis puniceicyclus]MBS2962755.1 AAA family ATPase [Actinocrinis puniceicyclus]
MTNAVEARRAKADWSAVRLHVVTGKGGTGKTTVAAALALALAAGGERPGDRRVLLVEVEGRQGLSQLFDAGPVVYEERRVAVTPDGGEVWAQALDAEQALLEYLDLFYKLGPAARALRRFGAIDFATTVAPGIRDVLLTGKTCEAVRRRAGHTHSTHTHSGHTHSGHTHSGHTQGRGKTQDRVFDYDAVVMDAPPTGRITRFLNVNSEVSGLARVGPIRNQADAVMRVLTSAQTAVHFVTLLEEMPVQETLDGIAELRAASLPTGGVIVNQARPVVLPEDRLKKAAQPGGLDFAELEAGLAPVGLADTDLVSALAELATEHAQRVLLEAAQREELTATEAPLYELPLLTDGVDRVGLDLLAQRLRDQGAA